MTELACEQFRALGPELALGIADGGDRAAASRHLQSCPECRKELRELAEVADGLAALAPAAEPPPGFAERVVASVTRPPRRRARSRAWLGAAAAALALIAGITGWLIGRPAPHPAYSTDVVAGELYTAGRPAGQVLVSIGGHLWMSVSVRANPADYWVTCQMETEAGRFVTVGAFALSGGTGYWAAAIPQGAGRSFRAVRLLDAGGQVLAQAKLARAT